MLSTSYLLVKAPSKKGPSTLPGIFVSYVNFLAADPACREDFFSRPMIDPILCFLEAFRWQLSQSPPISLNPSNSRCAPARLSLPSGTPSPFAISGMGLWTHASVQFLFPPKTSAPNLLFSFAGPFPAGRDFQFFEFRFPLRRPFPPRTEVFSLYGSPKWI